MLKLNKKRWHHKLMFVFYVILRLVMIGWKFGGFFSNMTLKYVEVYGFWSENQTVSNKSVKGVIVIWAFLLEILIIST